MTRLDFKLPDIGEGVTEGEIVEWFVREGDVVAEDDPMVEVMTDKATVTIGAPCDARVGQLREALEIVRSETQDRAEQVQMIFSDPYDDNWQKDFEIPIRS